MYGHCTALIVQRRRSPPLPSSAGRRLLDLRILRKQQQSFSSTRAWEPRDWSKPLPRLPAICARLPPCLTTPIDPARSAPAAADPSSGAASGSRCGSRCATAQTAAASRRGGPPIDARARRTPPGRPELLLIDERNAYIFSALLNTNFDTTAPSAGSRRFGPAPWPAAAGAAADVGCWSGPLRPSSRPSGGGESSAR